jgi:hypothetical protein
MLFLYSGDDDKSSVRKVVHFVFRWPDRGAIPPIVVSFGQVDTEQPLLLNSSQLPQLPTLPHHFLYPLQWSPQRHIYTWRCC